MSFFKFPETLWKLFLLHPSEEDQLIAVWNPCGRLWRWEFRCHNCDAALFLMPSNGKRTGCGISRVRGTAGAGVIRGYRCQLALRWYWEYDGSSARVRASTCSGTRRWWDRGVPGPRSPEMLNVGYMPTSRSSVRVKVRVGSPASIPPGRSTPTTSNPPPPPPSLLAFPAPFFSHLKLLLHLPRRPESPPFNHSPSLFHYQTQVHISYFRICQILITNISQVSIKENNFSDIASRYEKLRTWDPFGWS